MIQRRITFNAVFHKAMVHPFRSNTTMHLAGPPRNSGIA